MLASKEELAFLWDMAKKNSEENSFFKDINAISHPAIREINHLDVKLDDWKKLPQQGKAYYIEMESPYGLYTKVVSYNGVEYNAVMTTAEREKEKAGQAELKPLSDEHCKYFSDLSEKCKNDFFKDVWLIQFDPALAHEKANLKVMLPNDRIPAEKANYYSLKYTESIVRRDKSLFKEKDGVKIEFFALQSEQEYQVDYAKKQEFLQNQTKKSDLER